MKNKTHDYELVGTGIRFIALIIDGLIIGMIGGILGVDLELIGGGVISILAGIGYQWYFLTQHDGQTPGKMLTGIRVIKTDGSAITGQDAVMRYLGYFVGSIVLMLGFIWAIFDSKNQGWHDKFARTYVVRETPVVTTTPPAERVDIKVKNDQVMV